MPPGLHPPDGRRCWLGWSHTKNEVDYIGVRFTKKEGRVWWQHLAANIRDWQQMKELKREQTTAREIAGIVGVLMWDLSVSGDPKGTRSEVLKVMSEVGRKMAKYRSGEWDRKLELKPQGWNALIGGLERVCTQPPQLRRITKNHFRPTAEVFIATDSSSTQAAAIRIEEDGRPTPILIQYDGRTYQGQFRWNEQDAQESINWKETKVAIMAIKSILQYDRIEGLRIVLAEDNATAIANLKHFFTNQDADICGELIALLAELGETRLEVMYIKSALQPADMPSREPFVRCGASDEWLEKCRRSRIHMLDELGRLGRKRPREEEE